jgi:hypothetical protein
VNLKIPQHQLLETIRAHSMSAREGFQVARRLKQLLPEQLKGIKDKYRGNRKAAEAERLALIDPEYQKHVDDYLDLAFQASESRIVAETHRMLLEARQTARQNQLARPQTVRPRPSRANP